MFYNPSREQGIATIMSSHHYSDEEKARKVAFMNEQWSEFRDTMHALLATAVICPSCGKVEDPDDPFEETSRSSSCSVPSQEWFHYPQWPNRERWCPECQTTFEIDISKQLEAVKSETTGA